jgi:hypothetical protein
MSPRFGDPASPVAFLFDWTISFTMDRFDATTILDIQKVYGASITSVSGDFSGFYDTATAQSYAAASDGLPRNLYVYPSVDFAQYFSGMAVVDYAVTGGVGSAVGVKATWESCGAFAGAGVPGTYTATYQAVY